MSAPATTRVRVTAADLDARLRAHFAPLDSLVVRDDSAAHAGHAGAASGGHFTVVIRAPAFAGKARLARHRLVYDALKDLMDSGIHALAIDADEGQANAQQP
ncbi:BolA family protein [Sphaerotilus mobilis]|uniref:BolA protein family transcriptional regulator n=1 Tax=Sphaerotilus mobilis TaxID=47994 RepID=A0A4Q7LRM4_9BURK|nr:BolA family protein [Sphaerotilus mobilis]RZS56787.1 BolA protein family transcriptional regulator [Sphaerotilus mobilis]